MSEGYSPMVPWRSKNTSYRMRVPNGGNGFVPGIGGVPDMSLPSVPEKNKTPHYRFDEETKLFTPVLQRSPEQ